MVPADDRYRPRALRILPGLGLLHLFTGYVYATDPISRAPPDFPVRRVPSGRIYNWPRGVRPVPLRQRPESQGSPSERGLSRMGPTCAVYPDDVHDIRWLAAREHSPGEWMVGLVAPRQLSRGSPIELLHVCARGHYECCHVGLCSVHDDTAHASVHQGRSPREVEIWDCVGRLLQARTVEARAGSLVNLNDRKEFGILGYSLRYFIATRDYFDVNFVTFRNRYSSIECVPDLI